MGQSATARVSFATPPPLHLEASFDGGRLTSDGGLPWLAEAETHLGLCGAFAACLRDWRHARIRHSLPTLVRQRVFQIACGYEDQDDADSLRSDPLLKLVCGRLPESGPALASQPTLSRLENAVDRRACYRLAVALLGTYLREHQRLGVPTRILLDFDSTDDPPTARRRERLITATSASTCITRCWSSMATPTSSSPRCCGRATPTPGAGRSLSSHAWCARSAPAGLGQRSSCAPTAASPSRRATLAPPGHPPGAIMNNSG